MSLKEKIEAMLGDDTSLQEQFMHQDEDEELLKEHGLTSKVVDSYGGEDCGSTYYAVYEMSDGIESLFVRFDGHYQSHYGTDYQGYSFVTPKEKKVMEYS